MKIFSFLKCLFSVQHRCDMLYFFTWKFLLHISKPESLLYVSSGDTVDCYEGQVPHSSLLNESQNQAVHVNYQWFCLFVYFFCFSFQRWCIWNKWSFLKIILIMLPSFTWSYVTLYQMHITKKGIYSHFNALLLTLLFLSSQGNLYVSMCCFLAFYDALEL